jgi:uncharacterized membrane protein (DUF441 family)
MLQNIKKTQTPWKNILLEKLSIIQLAMEFLILYGTQMFITIFTIACHIPILSQMHPVHTLHQSKVFISLQLTITETLYG